MKTNRYSANCCQCGGRVAAGAGTLEKEGRRWRVAHLACNAENGPAVAVIQIGNQQFTQNYGGRCEDAPCCGCCSI